MHTAARLCRPDSRLTTLVAAFVCWLGVGVAPLVAQRGGTRPAPIQETPAASPRGALGVALQEKTGGPRTVVEVVSVVPGSLAAAAGVQAGDLLISVGGQAVTS